VKSTILMAGALSVAAMVAGCATPKVVDVRQPGDDQLSCAQIKDQHAAALKYEKDARSERGVTGTNAAAALFFLPGLLATYMNTEDAIRAAKDRQDLLARLSVSKNCGPIL
jgi:hypothetical protein